MSEGAPSRPMRYPYTYAAKLAQFPFKFHVNLSWYYKYYLIGVACTVPVIYKIHKAVNSPANKAFTKEKRLHAIKEGEEHLKHLH